MEPDVKQDPFWLKPNLFIRIVGLYLLVSKAIVILLLIDIYQMWISNGYTKSGLVETYLIPVIGVLLVWSVLSIIGSVKLFLLHKNGFWISFGAVILTLIVFPSAYAMYLNIANNFSTSLINTQANYAISSLTIGADITMIPLLIVARNRVKWKSKPSLSHNKLIK